MVTYHFYGDLKQIKVPKKVLEGETADNAIKHKNEVEKQSEKRLLKFKRYPAEC